MKSRFDSGKLVRNAQTEFPGWPYQFIMVYIEGMPGALAAEPQASAAAEAKAMPKASRLAFAEKANPKKYANSTSAATLRSHDDRRRAIVPAVVHRRQNA